MTACVRCMTEKIGRAVKSPIERVILKDNIVALSFHNELILSFEKLEAEYDGFEGTWCLPDRASVVLFLVSRKNRTERRTCMRHRPPRERDASRVLAGQSGH